MGTLVAWHEVGGESSFPRVALVFDVMTTEGLAFRGIADESMTITALTGLAVGQRRAVRYRPAVLDHYVALAPDVSPEQVVALAEQARVARER